MTPEREPYAPILPPRKPHIVPDDIHDECEKREAALAARVEAAHSIIQDLTHLDYECELGQDCVHCREIRAQKDSPYVRALSWMRRAPETEGMGG